MTKSNETFSCQTSMENKLYYMYINRLILSLLPHVNFHYNIVILGQAPVEVNVCEHQRLYIKCLNHEFIQIIFANYGRVGDNTTCPAEPHLMKDTNCISSTAVEKVKAACEDKHVCSLEATNAVFGDPCFGTYKYLSVVFHCIFKPKTSLP
jgi:hypothetical protein